MALATMAQHAVHLMLSHAQVSVYNLQSKVSTGIRQTLDGFVITNASVAYTPEHAMIMRFRRSFEGDFALGVDQVGTSVWSHCM